MQKERYTEVIWEFFQETNFLCLRVGEENALKAFEPVLAKRVAFSQAHSGPGREQQKQRYEGKELHGHVQDITSE